MSAPLYSFRFQHLQVQIPYTDVVLDIGSPWSYLISVGSCFVYLLLITAVFPLWSSSKSTNRFAQLHYTLLFVYSLFAFSAVLCHIVVSEEIFDWSKFSCTPVPPWLRLISISFTLSKVWEWIDTALLLWKGQSLRKIGFLHTYHHATTFLLFLCVMNAPGPEKCGMLLNGFVHTLMYYHFAYRLPKFLRPIITALQIVQLLTVMYVWYNVPNTCPKYATYPRENILEYLAPYTLVPVYCVFFFKFFVEQYFLSGSKSERSPSKKGL